MSERWTDEHSFLSLLSQEEEGNSASGAGTHHDHATLWNTTHVTSQGVNVWEGIELFLPHEGALDSVATPLPVHKAFLHLHAHAQLAQNIGTWSRDRYRCWPLQQGVQVVG